MATDEWITYGGMEFVNLSRTAQLAEVMGIDILWVEPSEVEWVQEATGEQVDYTDITLAPWYEVGVPESAEFAGYVVLGMPGLGDSTKESATVEYVTSGGSSGRARNKTLSIVASVAIIASTERGADFGKRWLDRLLAGRGARQFCAGSEMEFYRYEGNGVDVPPKDHYRDVTLSRGTSITRKRVTECAAMLTVTFTLTANDPFLYGETEAVFGNFGGGQIGYPIGGTDRIISIGQSEQIVQSCAVYDYTPIYDPLHPALVAPPTVPDFYPAGWDLPEGRKFRRYWARISPVLPASQNMVPYISLTVPNEARMVRISIWANDTEPACDPLWTTTITYLPAGLKFVLDGEQQAAYAWDGVSPQVRRTDSLAYGDNARPLDWTSFNDVSGYYVALDIMYKNGSTTVLEGNGNIRMEFALTPKSD